MSNEIEPIAKPENIGLKDAFKSIIASLWRLLKSKPFWGYIVFFSAISLSVFFLLGFGFYLIVIGLQMTLVLLAMVYSPASRILAAIIGVAEDKTIHFAGPQWGKFLILWSVVIWLGTSALGIWILLKYGFLAQNMVYLMFLK